MDHPQHPPRTPGLGLSLSVVPSNEAIDPVCGMTVDPASAPASIEHEGKKYYFCCPHCAQKFQADPKRYLHPESRTEPMETALSGRLRDPARQAAPPGAKVEYICPMHPEVVSDRP